MLVTYNGYDYPTLDGTTPLSWSLGLYFTPAEAEVDYPRMRAVIRAMQMHRPAQLAAERDDMLRGSFDRLFGPIARKCLGIIDETQNSP
jgi:hypothetical protein